MRPSRREGRVTFPRRRPEKSLQGFALLQLKHRLRGKEQALRTFLQFRRKRGAESQILGIEAAPREPALRGNGAFLPSGRSLEKLGEPRGKFLRMPPPERRK